MISITRIRWQDFFAPMVLAVIVAGPLIGQVSRGEDEKNVGRKALAEIDRDAVKAQGIREYTGKHLVLFTDSPDEKVAKELVAVFDQAVEPWRDYFHVKKDAAADWLVIGCWILDKEKFGEAGLLRVDLPPFRNGYSFTHQLWFYEQPYEYYRRHLLLHEGTHAFMNTFLGGAGPPWYMEGTAELFGTHRLTEKGLELGVFPQDREQFGGWGRIKLVRESMKEGRHLTLDKVLAYDLRAHLEDEPYGWCWAIAAFLNGHPRYKERFLKLQEHARARNFNELALRAFADDLRDLREEWLYFSGNIDFGFDLEREAIEMNEGEPLTQGSKTGSLLANRGWQSSGIVLRQDRMYRIEARGRFQLGTVPKVWKSEANGVSVKYYQGTPVGKLQGTIRPLVPQTDVECCFLKPINLGSAADLTPEFDGTLYLRINDGPDSRADNDGELKFKVVAE